MEEARTHRRRTVTKSPLGKFTRLLSRLYLLVTLIFMGLLCYSQFLTTKTLIIVAVALFVAFLLIFQHFIRIDLRNRESLYAYFSL